MTVTIRLRIDGSYLNSIFKKVIQQSNITIKSFFTLTKDNHRSCSLNPVLFLSLKIKLSTSEFTSVTHIVHQSLALLDTLGQVFDIQTAKIKNLC
jgi:hypothetical protein